MTNRQACGWDLAPIKLAQLVWAEYGNLAPPGK